VDQDAIRSAETRIAEVQSAWTTLNACCRRASPAPLAPKPRRSNSGCCSRGRRERRVIQERPAALVRVSHRPGTPTRYRRTVRPDRTRQRL